MAKPKPSPTGEWHVVLVHKTNGTKTIRMHGGLLEPQAIAAAFRKAGTGWQLKSSEKVALARLKCSPEMRAAAFDRSLDLCLRSS